MQQFQSKIDNPINNENIMYMNNEIQGNSAINKENVPSRDFSSYKARPIGARNLTKFLSKKQFVLK